MGSASVKNAGKCLWGAVFGVVATATPNGGCAMAGTAVCPLCANYRFRTYRPSKPGSQVRPESADVSNSCRTVSRLMGKNVSFC